VTTLFTIEYRHLGPPRSVWERADFRPGSEQWAMEYADVLRQFTKMARKMLYRVVIDDGR
jgi:hypothetical protein